MSRFRTGFGVDVHQLVPGRPLIIGGIHISFSKGALGHSDADVLLHAIADALLGALALGDIGQHFPDTDSVLKDIQSSVILEKVHRMIQEKGYSIGNIDSTIVLQEPKLSDHIPAIRENIANIISLEMDQISVKATTNEHLGIIGKGEGIAAYAVVLVEESN
jgi:2-C-methyl-D-erythritol 2,4-cyclodiphosphate synthase